MVSAVWRILVVIGIMGAATPASNARTMAAATLTPALRAMLVNAASGPEDMAVLMARVAAQAVPGSDREILEVIEAHGPAHTASVAYTLDHRHETQKAPHRPVPAPVRAPAARAPRAPVQTASAAPVYGTVIPNIPREPRMFNLAERGMAFTVRPATLEHEWNPKPLGIDRAVTRNGGFLNFEFLVRMGIETRTLKSDEWRMDSLVQMNRDLTDRHYIFVTARYDKSPDTGYDYRALVAPGMGYRIYNRENFSWRVEAGAGVRYDKADTPYRYEDRYGIAASIKTTMAPAAMVASKVSWHVPRYNVTVENSTMGVVSNSSSLSNLTSVVMPLSERMEAGFSFDMRFNTNRPYEEDSRAFDTIAKVNFKYTW